MNGRQTTVKSVRQSVIRIVTKLNKLRKLPSSAQKSRLLSCFLSEVYHIPTIFVSHGKIVTPVSSSSSCSSCAESEVLKAVNTQLCQELSALSVKASSLKSSDEKLSETRQKMYSLHRNVNKKLKRRNSFKSSKKK